MINQLSQLIIDTWYFFKGHFRNLCYLMLPVIIPLSILNMIILSVDASGQEMFWLVIMIGVISYPIIQGILILYIMSAVADEYTPKNIYYKLSFKLWAPLMVVYLISSVATAVGLVLLIIPGLIVFARLIFSEFYCVLYDEKPMDAVKHSWNKSKEHQWLILLGLIVVALITELPVWVIEKAIEYSGVTNPVFGFVFFIVNYVMGWPITIFAFRVFMVSEEKLID